MSLLFTWPNEAASVELAGTFNNWTLTPMHRSSDTKWTLTITGLIPGTYEYKFHVNGRYWCFDSLKPITRDSAGNVNNWILVDGSVESDYLVPVPDGNESVSYESSEEEVSHSLTESESESETEGKQKNLESKKKQKKIKKLQGTDALMALTGEQNPKERVRKSQKFTTDSPKTKNQQVNKKVGRVMTHIINQPRGHGY